MRKKNIIACARFINHLDIFIESNIFDPEQNTNIAFIHSTKGFK